MNNRQYITGNPAVLKKINTARVLHQLRFTGPASRAELARRTGLDAKTLTNVTSGLLQEGLIRCQPMDVHGRGRPGERVSIAPEAALGVGVDLGSEHVTAAVVDLAGAVRGEVHEEFASGPDQTLLLERIPAVVEDLVRRLDAADRKRIKGLGICVPGFLDRARGVVLEAVNLPGFRDVPIVGLLADRFGYRVDLEEASRTLALAELWFGRRTENTHFICVDLGVGTGLGIIHHGDLYRGVRERSGEIGHTVVVPRGLPCRCGKRGCLETVASGRALARQAADLPLRKYGIQATGAKAVYLAAMAGDRQARAILRRAGEYIGMAVANVINLFDPDRVILNGGLVGAGAFLVEPLKQAVKTHCVRSGDSDCPIEISTLGRTAGAMGAAMLPLRGYFEYETIRFWS